MQNPALWGFFCIAASVTLTVVLSLTWGHVDETSVCLLMNYNTYSVDRKAYSEAGRYAVGPEYRFVCFPKSVQVIQFNGSESLTSRTSEGFEIGLDISVEYRLNSSEIYELYTKYGNDWHQQAERVSRASLRNAASQFEGLTYVTYNPSQGNRADIGRAMHEKLAVDLRKMHAEIESLQLRKIELSSDSGAGTTRFDQIFLDRELEKLKQKQLQKVHIVNMTKLSQENETKVVKLQADRTIKQVKEMENYITALISREQRLIETEMTYKRRILRANSSAQANEIELMTKVIEEKTRRNSTLTRAQLSANTGKLDAMTDANRTQIQANASVYAALERRVGVIFKAENERIEAELKANTTRDVRLKNTNASVQQAIFSREEALTVARTALIRAQWKYNETVLRAENALTNRLAVAENDYIRRRAIAEAEADALKDRMFADVQRFKDMKTAAGDDWKPKHMLQWKHNEALEAGGDVQNARVFADYTRNTLVLEAA